MDKSQQFENDNETFGGTLPLNRIRDLIRQASDWVNLQQCGVDLSVAFWNLDASRMNNIPSGGAADCRNALLNKPSRVVLRLRSNTYLTTPIHIDS